MKQEDFLEINVNIAKWGCYLLCLLFICEKYLNIKFKQQDVLELYLNLVKKNLISENCFIYDPSTIINFVFSFYKLNRRVKTSFATDLKDKLKDFRFTDMICKVKNGFGGTHFIVCDKDLNKVYDPSSVVEKKVNNNYYFISFRLFEI